MADIFISYSSFNREKATALVGGLRAAGHDVWMDQGGIGGAMDWSSEIVEALNKAKTVLFFYLSNRRNSQRVFNSSLYRQAGDSSERT